MARLPKPRVAPTEITVFNAADIAKLLHTAKTGKNPLRDTAIVTVLLDTGIRVGKLANLELPDVLWVDAGVRTGETVPFTCSNLTKWFRAAPVVKGGIMRY